MSAESEIRRLNEQYVRASLDSDVEWYRKHLANEFVCIDSDGSVLDKPAFLANTAKKSDLATYDFEAVNIRFYGDVALVRCTGKWKTHAGKPGISQYLDIYVKAGGEWKCVSAQITRPAM
ncbi:MAG TPA: nuclear transport factor 2 family protein [Gemmatimonadaceae bacterium]